VKIRVEAEDIHYALTRKLIIYLHATAFTLQPIQLTKNISKFTCVGNLITLHRPKNPTKYTVRGTKKFHIFIIAVTSFTANQFSEEIDNKRIVSVSPSTP